MVLKTIKLFHFHFNFKRYSLFLSLCVFLNIIGVIKREMEEVVCNGESPQKINKVTWWWWNAQTDKVKWIDQRWLESYKNKNKKPLWDSKWTKKSNIAPTFYEKTRNHNRISQPLKIINFPKKRKKEKKNRELLLNFIPNSLKKVELVLSITNGQVASCT